MTMGTAFSIRTEYPACFEGEACNPVPPAQKVQHKPPAALPGTGAGSQRCLKALTDVHSNCNVQSL